MSKHWVVIGTSLGYVYKCLQTRVALYYVQKKPCLITLMSVLINKFLIGFGVSNKVNFQNYFANKLIRWFIQKIAARVLSGLRHHDSKVTLRSNFSRSVFLHICKEHAFFILLPKFQAIRA